MSALNLIVRPDAAYLFTDGSTISDGEVWSPMPKVVALPHLSAAAANRGNLILLWMLANRINFYRRTFVEAVRHLAEDLRWSCEQLRGKVTNPVGN